MIETLNVHNINMFAESAGKKGGDFYTPRDVIRLMVRLIKPRPGLSVYDPTCGSGGMLIISREFIAQSGGDPTNVRLCVQVNDALAWSWKNAVRDVSWPGTIGVADTQAYSK